MWIVNSPGDLNIKMAEEDYGILLPIEINGITFNESDEVKITIKTAMNGETILEKPYSNIQNGTIPFELTAEESAKLPMGSYVYRIDWYQNGNFMCNLVLRASLKVVDKA